MKLSDLAGVASDSSVTGFALDHRKVAAGNVFGAFRGSRFNGEDFISEAVKRGAAAVVARTGATSRASCSRSSPRDSMRLIRRRSSR